MKCSGCGGEIEALIILQIKDDILERGGHPETVVIDYCDNCPPGALAEYEFLKLQKTPKRGFGIYEG